MTLIEGLIRLAGRFEGGRRTGAMATAAAAIACSLALIAQAKPLELALAVVPLAAAGLLYLWLKRR